MNKRMLSEEEWTGSGLNTIVHADWNPAMAHAALQRLDGRRLTQLQLDVGEDRSMLIGGGAGRLSVIICVDVDRELHTLLDPGKADTEHEDLLVGGQLGNFAANQIVSAAAALAAIHYFHAAGEPSPHLSWQTGGAR
ncbi:Imm1 family immunity protein [Massilia mucilaginosa]|nr:Imm1 family immunity protein [Massilia mucilaginosa]